MAKKTPQRKPQSPAVTSARYQGEPGPHPAQSPTNGEETLRNAPDCQAKRIIIRFGGVQALLAAMLRAGVRRTAQSVYHWVREGGLIPPNGVRDVFLAEVQAGIRLSDEDWSPYVRLKPPVAPPGVAAGDLEESEECEDPTEESEVEETPPVAPPAARRFML